FESCQAKSLNVPTTPETDQYATAYWTGFICDTGQSRRALGPPPPLTVSSSASVRIARSRGAAVVSVVIVMFLLSGRRHHGDRCRQFVERGDLTQWFFPHAWRLGR